MISYAREIILIFCVLNVPVVLQTTIKPTTTTAKGITTTVNGQKAAVSSTTIGNSGSSTTSPPVVERCPVRTPVKNGRLVHSTNETSRQHIYGTTGTLICDNNFIPIGPLISTCINKSVWTEIGECVDKSKIKCQPIAEDKNGGKLTYTQSSGDLLGLGTVLKLTCRQNATATGTTELKCGTTGWEPSTGMGTCAENTKKVKRQANNLITTTSTGTSNCQILQINNGNSIVLNCSNGFNPASVSASICINSQFNQPIGSCQQTITFPMTVVQSTFGVISQFNNVNTGSIGGSCAFAISQPPGGTITYSSGTSIGPFVSSTTATLICQNSATYGATFSICQNGMWNPTTLGTCSSSTTNNGGTTCPGAPLGGLGGMVTYTNNQFFGPFQAGTTSNLACSMGTTLSGSNSATCSNGLWNPTTLGSCNFGTSLGGTTGTGQCFSGVIAPSNGQVTYSNLAIVGPFPAGTIATYTCSLNFVKSSEFTSICTNGVFTPSTPPTCNSGSTNTGLVSNCYTLPVPLFGTVTYSPPANPATPGASYTIGTTATISCNSGYTLSGLSTITCQSTGWSSFNFGICQSSLVNGDSKKEPCSIIKDLPHGVISYENNNLRVQDRVSHGTTAYLYCYFGTNPLGFQKTSCNDGNWKPLNIGNCVKEDEEQISLECKKFKEKEGVIFEYSENSVKIRCLEGYDSNGINELNCIKGNVWNIDKNNVSFCTKKQIEDEENIVIKNTCNPLLTSKTQTFHYSNTQMIDGNYPLHTTVKLLCEPGNILIGNPITYCIGGIFIPDIGYCKNKAIQQSVKIEEEPLIGKFSPTSCNMIKIPDNGNIKYIQSSSEFNNDVGTSALLKCENGFKLHGRPLVTCTINGWVPITGLGFCKNFKHMMTKF